MFKGVRPRPLDVRNRTGNHGLLGLSDQLQTLLLHPPCATLGLPLRLRFYSWDPAPKFACLRPARTGSASARRDGLTKTGKEFFILQECSIAGCIRWNTWRASSIPPKLTRRFTAPSRRHWPSSGAAGLRRSIPTFCLPPSFIAPSRTRPTQ